MDKPADDSFHELVPAFCDILHGASSSVFADTFLEPKPFHEPENFALKN